MTDPILQMLAYELAAIFAVISIWLIVRELKKRKKIHTDADKAVKKLTKAKDSRIKALTTLLSEKYGLVDDALEQTATNLQAQEQQIYKVLLTNFVDQDAKALTEFPVKLEQAIDECLNLLPVVNDASDAEEISDDEIEVAVAVADEEDEQINTDLEDEIEVGVEIDSDSDDEVEVGVATESELNEEIEDQEIAPESEEPEPESTSVESDEEIISADDVDALLEGLDVEVSADEDSDEVIDLSAPDKEDEEELKKTEAESVNTAADSAISTPQQGGEDILDASTELDSIESRVEEVAAESESEQLAAADIVTDDDIEALLNQVDNEDQDEVNIEEPEPEPEP